MSVLEIKVGVDHPHIMRESTKFKERMEKNTLFSSEIIQKIKSTQTAQVLQPIQVGQTARQNELLFFVKPELLIVKDNHKVLNSLALIQQKFSQWDVEVCGAAIIPGGVLDEHEIMNRHYGFINQLSQKASTMINDEIRAEMFNLLELTDDGTHQVLGGHEFLSLFNADLGQLSDLWFGKGACKLRSGFYFVETSFQDNPIILVNGFHPSQLQHFTREDHRIYLLLLHTNADWYEMKFDLVGDTFPENAKPESIRGCLFADPDHFGLEKVSINTNGVHLSAGPFEAAFEIQNFFGSLSGSDIEVQLPLAVKRAIEAGLSPQIAQSLLDNPTSKDQDLFTETENMNTDAAVELAKKWFLS